MQSLALEILYGEKIEEDSAFTRAILDYWWKNLRNVEGVRNRFKITKVFLKEQVSDLFAKGRKKIVIFSIASGSARAVIETAAWAKKKFSLEVIVCLLDRDANALARAKDFAQELNVSVTTFENDVNDFIEIAKNLSEKIDIIEMVGFLDYRTDHRVVELVSNICSVLPEHGVLVTAQILPNEERWFVKWVLRWPMIYRTADHFLSLLKNTGFEGIDMVVESCRVHVVAFLRKKVT